MFPLRFKLFILLTSMSAFETNNDSPKESRTNVKAQAKAYKYIKNRISLIKKECGTLCDVDPLLYTPISDENKFYYVPIQKTINCERLWNNSIFDEKSQFRNAIQKIPKYLEKHFSYDGMVDVKPYYFDENEFNIWNETFNAWGKPIKRLSD